MSVGLDALGIEILQSPEMTGEWEHKLKEIEHGRIKRVDFMREILRKLKPPRAPTEGSLLRRDFALVERLLEAVDPFLRAIWSSLKGGY
jgi:hypothetical protein